MIIRVIARRSRLSQLQVQEAMARFPDVNYRLETLSSYGDQHQQISLLNGEAPADMFTRELDEALIKGRADIAIHSAKDLPYPLDERLEVIALFPPFDQSDSLVSRDHLTLSKLPAGSSVGTSSPMRRRELLTLRPDLKIVGIRGCIEERVRQVRDGKIDAAIVATCALKRLGMEDDISEVLPFETHPLQGYLAITSLKGRTDLKVLFERDDVLHRQGHVTLVGFGPGDPELLTVKAVKALQQADVIFYDDLIDKHYLDTLKAEKCYVGKRKGLHHSEQHEINRLLLKAAREGKQVVRLKGGDPMVFGHAGEEIEYLQSNLISVTVIPGITTASAMAAATKVSLTQRGISSSVALVNGHADVPIVADTDTIVYYMGGSRLSVIRESLLAEGWSVTTPVILVHNVSLPDEQTFETTISQLGDDDYPTPVIALVGDVAKLRRQTASSIQRTLYTGLVSPNPDYIHTPMIEIEPVSYAKPSTESYDYLLFTSRYAVKCWTGGFSGRIVSIGSSTTQALKEAGAVEVEQTEQDDSYGVIDYFRRQPRGRVLIPRSSLALNIIPDGLSQLGFVVTTLTVYNNVFPHHVRRVNLANIQRVVFTSPSTIDNFIKTYGNLPAHIEYVTRGSITAQHLKSRQNETIQNIQKGPGHTG